MAQTLSESSFRERLALMQANRLGYPSVEEAYSAYRDGNLDLDEGSTGLSVMDVLIGASAGAILTLFVCWLLKRG
jgi:hypothetical protein